MENKLKLEINQLKNYLGTRLEFKTSRHQITYGEVHVIKMNGLSLNTEMDLNIEFLYNDDLLFSDRMKKVYPIMYRLQDLDKFIPELGFVPLHKLLELYCFDLTKMGEEEILSYKESMIEVDMSLMVAEKLFEWHFWIFDQEYFEQGLIIDKLKHNGNQNNQHQQG